MKQLTHKQLIKIGKQWLKRVEGCFLVISERPADGSPETADILGYKSSRHSILIECKASRADFRKDKEKWFREEGLGMGQQRFFLAQKGIIPITEVPPGWGLIEVSGKQATKTVSQDLLHFDQAKGWAELPLLVAELKRVNYKLESLRRKKGLS